MSPPVNKAVPILDSIDNRRLLAFFRSGYGNGARTLGGSWCVEVLPCLNDRLLSWNMASMATRTSTSVRVVGVFREIVSFIEPSIHPRPSSETEVDSAEERSPRNNWIV